MAQKESSIERVQKSMVSSLVPSEVTAMGQKRIQELANVQTELLAKLEESNKQWLARLQSEIQLASELVSRLTGVRSIPDAATAYQEWTSRRLQMVAEDGKHLFSDAQSFMETGARLLSTGWSASSRSGIT